MVAAMNGFIQIESIEGNGTTVSVSVPQKAADNTPCMKVENRENLCIACYLKPEKYKIPAVRDYYNAAISHMVRETGLSIHRVFAPEEMKKLIGAYRLTHLFIGKEEYTENASYFEELDKAIEIIVVWLRTRASVRLRTTG